MENIQTPTEVPKYSDPEIQNAIERRRQEIIKLRQKGMTLKAIGELFRISKQRVSQILKGG